MALADLIRLLLLSLSQKVLARLLDKVGLVWSVELHRRLSDVAFDKLCLELRKTRWASLRGGFRGLGSLYSLADVAAKWWRL